VEDGAELERVEFRVGELLASPDLERERSQTFRVPLHAAVADLDGVGEHARHRRSEEPLAQLDLRQQASVDRRFDLAVELDRLERLGDETGGTAVQRLSQVRLVDRAGDQDDRQAWPPRVERVDQLEPGDAARHVDVAEHECHVLTLEDPDRLLT
jgi:hypothetical protein